MTDLTDGDLRALLDAATEGPWDVALENGCHGIIAAVLPDGANIIAIIGNDRATPERQQMRFANARLIAAARDLAAEVLQLRERVRGFEAGQEWQPIETAPRGEWFMAWFPDEFVEGVGGYHMMTRQRFSASLGWVWTTVLSGAIGINPTHWMPLPAPPKEEE